MSSIDRPDALLWCRRIHQSTRRSRRPIGRSNHPHTCLQPGTRQRVPLESCSLPAAVRRLAGALALRGVGAPPACCGLHPRRPCVEGARLLATRSGSQWWSSKWAWLAGACGTRSRRGAGPHCALPPEHGRTTTCCASRSLSLVSSTVSCVLCLVVLLLVCVCLLEGCICAHSCGGPTLSNLLINAAFMTLCILPCLSPPARRRAPHP